MVIGCKSGVNNAILGTLQQTKTLKLNPKTKIPKLYKSNPKNLNPKTKP